MDMQGKQYHSVHLFRRQLEPLLLKNEAAHNLFYGVLLKINETNSPIFMGLVEKENRVVMGFLQTNPAQIIVATFSALDEQDLEAIALWLYQQKIQVPGLIGEVETIHSLVKAYERLAKVTYEVRMRQRIYQLTEVAPLPKVNGLFRKAVEKDTPIICRWIHEFCEEIGEVITFEEAKKEATKLMKEERVFVWEVNSQPVSMACWTRPTKTNVTINLVFTPKEERKKGYATACVAHLSQHLLNQGYKSTSLYTDLANPTSNHIYQEIGYRPILDSIYYRQA